MNASELKEDARKRAIQVAMPASFYLFNEKQLESYKEQLCKEQRENCVEFFINGGNRQGSFIAEDLLNAPEPE